MSTRAGINAYSHTSCDGCLVILMSEMPIVLTGDARGTRFAYTIGRKQNDCGGHYSANIRAARTPRRLLIPHGCPKGQPFPRLQRIHSLLLLRALARLC